MPTVPRIQPPFSNPSIKTRKMGLPSSCPQRHIKGLKISAPRFYSCPQFLSQEGRGGGKNGVLGIRRLHLFSALRPERWPHLSWISSPSFTLLLSTCWAQHTAGIASTQAEGDPYSCTSIQKMASMTPIHGLKAAEKEQKESLKGGSWTAGERG